MSHCAHSHHPAFSQEGEGHPRFYGPPLPLKVLAIGAAFLVCPPLGLAALAFAIWRGWGGGCRGAGERGPGFRRFRATGNGALDEKRRETLKALDEEAEAFAEFQRDERKARDREIYERFTAGRTETK
jgi:hypothetical protein